MEGSVLYKHPHSAWPYIYLHIIITRVHIHHIMLIVYCICFTNHNISNFLQYNVWKKKTASSTLIVHVTVIVTVVVICRYWHEASGMFPLYWLAYSISQEFMTLQNARGHKHSDIILYDFISSTLTGQYFKFYRYWCLYRKLAYTYWVKPGTMP